MNLEARDEEEILTKLKLHNFELKAKAKQREPGENQFEE